MTTNKNFKDELVKAADMNYRSSEIRAAVNEVSQTELDEINQAAETLISSISTEKNSGYSDDINKVLNNTSETLGSVTTATNTNILNRSMSSFKGQGELSEKLQEVTTIVANLSIDKNFKENRLLSVVGKVPFLGGVVKNQLVEYEKNVKTGTGLINGIFTSLEDCKSSLIEDNKEYTQIIQQTINAISINDKKNLLLKALKIKANEKKAYLLSIKKEDYAETIEEMLIFPLNQQILDCEELIGADILQFQNLTSIKKNNEIIVKELERSKNTTVKLIENGLIAAQGAMQAKNSIQLIQTARKISNELMISVSKALNENQKNVFELQKTGNINFDNYLQSYAEAMKRDEEAKRQYKEINAAKEHQIAQLEKVVSYVKTSLPQNKEAKLSEAIEMANTMPKLEQQSVSGGIHNNMFNKNVVAAEAETVSVLSSNQQEALQKMFNN